MKKASIILGLISSVMIILGCIFKMQHWPGAGLLIVFGAMIHVLAFLPLWMISRVAETQGGVGKASVIVGFVALFIFYLAILFLLQHWPGGMPFLWFSILIALFGVVPLVLINFKRERERTAGLLPVLLIVAPIIMMMMARSTGRAAVDSYITVDRSLKKIPASLRTSCDIFYAKIESLRAANPEPITSFHDKAMMLRKRSNELVAYINAVRTEIVSMTENIPKDAADTLPAHYMRHTDNYDIPTHILIGDDPANSKDGEFSAKEIRRKIMEYREFASQLVGNDREALKHIGLRTNDVDISYYGPRDTWETGTFYNRPMGAVLNVLEAIKIEIRNAELITVRELSFQASDVMPVKTIEPGKPKE